MEKELLEKVQNLEFKILQELDRICTKHGFVYFLAYGTLLGAVRHRGFIPWDDDLDVFMPRDDYDKFLEICSQELGEEFVLHCHETDEKYPLSMTKIRLTNTVFREKAMKVQLKYEGIWVDIFVLDEAKHKTSRFQRFQFKAVSSLNAMIGVRLGQRSLHSCSCATKLAYYLLRFLSVNDIYRLQKKLRKRSLGKKGAYMVEFSGCYGQRRQTFEKEALFPAKRISFGSGEFMAPHDPDSILKCVYGEDYMTPPPVEKRKTHSPAAVDLGSYLN